MKQILVALAILVAAVSADCAAPVKTGYAFTATGGGSCLLTASSICNVACATGYSGTVVDDAAAPVTALSCDDPEWDTLVANLVGCAIDCVAPERAGYVISGESTSLAVGAERTVAACAEGYFGTVSATITCTAGAEGAASTWVDLAGLTACTQITCTADSCEAAPEGYAVTCPEGAVNWGVEAATVCAEGFQGTPIAAKCGSATPAAATGAWIAPSGCSNETEPVTECPALYPEIPAGYLIPEATNRLPGNTTAYTCDTANGYAGEGGVITCGTDFTWGAPTGCAKPSGAAIVIPSAIVVMLCAFLLLL
jgi:hypothetical protein